MANGRRAGLDRQPHQVAAMFDQVAAAYDRTNTVISPGRDRVWPKATLAALAPRSGEPTDAAGP
jgi:demethylmenaquinone methyltransferase/2-methoxy-6-polyprenyl-1,4-benzoquinol methylase